MDEWNVYAWNVAEHARGKKVAEKVSYSEAQRICDLYFDKGPMWDAYMVRSDDDDSYEDYDSQFFHVL